LAYPGYWGIFWLLLVVAGVAAVVVVAGFVHLSPSYFCGNSFTLFLIPLDDG
jgi:hypothetical protein